MCLYVLTTRVEDEDKESRRHESSNIVYVPSGPLITRSILPVVASSSTPGTPPAPPTPPLRCTLLPSLSIVSSRRPELPESNLSPTKTCGGSRVTSFSSLLTRRSAVDDNPCVLDDSPPWFVVFALVSAIIAYRQPHTSLSLSLSLFLSLSFSLSFSYVYEVVRIYILFKFYFPLEYHSIIHSFTHSLIVFLLMRVEWRALSPLRLPVSPSLCVREIRLRVQL